MKQFLTLLLLLTMTFASAQLVDFENFNLAPETYLDGSDGSGGFTSSEIYLPNSYYDDGTYAYWESGWVISNTTDVVSMAQANESSAITGGGAAGSSTYAVATASFGEAIMHFSDPGNGNTVTSLFITNSTLAYQTMLNGGPFGQKVFGGLTGDDPDFFLLTIKGYKNGVLMTDSVDFYLADFRFTNNEEDYLVDEWTEVDLSAIEAPDSLSFTLTSSDNNAFGMLTPGYFCVDNINVNKTTAIENIEKNNAFTISPNPARGFVLLSNTGQDADCFIYDLNGRLVYKTIVRNESVIDIGSLTSGTYVVKVIGNDGIGTELLVVN